MPADLVAARPERLQTFRSTAGALAEGLEERRAAVGRARMAYQAATEAAFEVDVGAALDAAVALAAGIRELGSWVGGIGDAFERLPLGSVFPGSPELVLGPELGHLGDVAEGVAADHLQAVAAADDVAASAGRTVQRAVVRGAITASQLATVIAALRTGVAEVRHRWGSEPDRPSFERGARAGLDGALNTGAILGGGAAGAAAGTWACGPAGRACAALGQAFGSQLGGQIGEAVGDVILGDEPPAWARDPVGLTADIADPDLDADVLDVVAVDLDEVAADASVAAGRHANFVVEHPWVWADTYADAPVHAPPPPAPDVLVAGAGPR
jgi:hypothetical protein